MTKIRFYLKRPQSHKKTSLYMMVNYGGYRMVKGRKSYLPLKYYIGESILPAFWDQRANKAKETKDFPEHDLLNQRLCHIESVVRILLLDIKVNGNKKVKSELREELNHRIKRQSYIEEERKRNLFYFIEQFIVEAKSIRSEATIKQYKNTLRLLKDFSAKVQRINFYNIDMSFYSKFRQYMDNAGYSECYFSNQIKYVRLFMNEATERGYNEYVSYKNRKFICPQVTADKIYLTSEEIARIHSLQFPGEEKFEKVRDMFIIACHTGLRFSDLVRLQPFNFHIKEKMLYIRTQKTNATVYIPLSPDVMNICKKYNYQLPRYSNSVFNTCLKEIGRQAGFVDMVEVSISRGNGKTRIIVPKYRLITSHTARRSFATNAFLANVPNLSIMQITGHSTEKAFMKYIRVSGEDNARRLLVHPYFSRE